MALITCPDCGKSISDKAPACPQCGCPVQQQTPAEPPLPPAKPKGPLYEALLEPEVIREAKPISSKPSRISMRRPAPSNTLNTRLSPANHTTIEHTSKPLKAQGCLAGIMVIVGAGMMFSPLLVLGVILVGIGLVWGIITRILIWWHHD